MTLTFDEYQDAALKTAVYPRQYVLMAEHQIKPGSPTPCIYPIFGLCGEAGEFIEVALSPLGQQSDLIKEAGDVLWYVAAICSDLSMRLKDVVGCTDIDAIEGVYLFNAPSPDELAQELFKSIGRICEATKKSIRDANGILSAERLKLIKDQLRNILVIVWALCSRYCSNFSVIAQFNLDKLAARAASGTLQGSGNNR